MSSSEYTWRAQIDKPQKWLLEKRKRINDLIEDVNQQDWKEKKHGTSGGKKEEETYGRNTKQLKMNEKYNGKCKNEPKLFYRYINEKIKSRERVDKLKVEDTVHKDVLQLAEVMNKRFQTVFSRESEFRMNNIEALDRTRFALLQS